MGRSQHNLLMVAFGWPQSACLREYGRKCTYGLPHRHYGDWPLRRLSLSLPLFVLLSLPDLIHDADHQLVQVQEAWNTLQVVNLIMVLLPLDVDSPRWRQKKTERR